jgi:hypothetical protein
VVADGGPDPLGQQGDPVGPGGAGRGVGVDGVEDPIEDEALDLLAAADVAVQRHGPSAQLGGHRPHGEARRAGAFEDGERGGADVVEGQRSGPRHGALQSVLRTPTVWGYEYNVRLR